MAYLVEVDEAVCLAHTDCLEAAPGVFAVDDVARVIGTAADDRLLAAAEACPSAAIRVLDASTGEQIYP